MYHCVRDGRYSRHRTKIGKSARDTAGGHRTTARMRLSMWRTCSGHTNFALERPYTGKILASIRRPGHAVGHLSRNPSAKVAVLAVPILGSNEVIGTLSLNCYYSALTAASPKGHAPSSKTRLRSLQTTATRRNLLRMVGVLTCKIDFPGVSARHSNEPDAHGLNG